MIIKLIFEGEYINNIKQNGKEYGYDYDNNLVFEGEYLNGRIWNIKVYDKFGNLLYELINGNGKIKEFDFFGN